MVIGRRHRSHLNQPRAASCVPSRTATRGRRRQSRRGISQAAKDHAPSPRWSRLVAGRSDDLTGAAQLLMRRSRRRGDPNSLEEFSPTDESAARAASLTSITKLLTKLQTVAIPVGDQDRTQSLLEELGFTTPVSASPPPTLGAVHVTLSEKGLDVSESNHSRSIDSHPHSRRAGCTNSSARGPSSTKQPYRGGSPRRPASRSDRTQRCCAHSPVSSDSPTWRRVRPSRSPSCPAPIVGRRRLQRGPRTVADHSRHAVWTANRQRLVWPQASTCLSQQRGGVR